MSTGAVLFVAFNLGDRSGAATTARHAMRAAAEAGCDVQALTSSPEAADAIVLGPRPRGGKGMIAWLTDARYHWTTRGEAMSQLQDVKPDRVIVNSLGSLGLWQTVQSRFNCPTTLVLQESPRHLPNTPTDAIHMFDELVFASSRCRDEWAKLIDRPDLPMHTVPNTCEPEPIDAVLQLDRADVRRELGIADDRFAVVCVASVQHRKGQDLLIDHLPDAAHLYLVGEDDYPLARQLKARTPGDRVTYVGHSDHALKWTYAADVLALASRAEAMPLTVLEAMALGTPVVASDVDGIPELITDGETGVLFPISQPADLHDALLTDRAALLAMAKRAQQRFATDFAWPAYSKRWRDILIGEEKP